ncbi:MAG: DNA internalization-related competence protein ComEC/Rec2 [Nitrospinae bacterium]|nr:DNA internalization-related competence protein ComEC/Rec2 [Nitrospinota bacterium]
MKKPVIPILLFYIAGILYGRYLPLHLIHLTVFIIFTLLVAATLRLRFLTQAKACGYLILLPTLSILAGAVAINYQSLTLPDNHLSRLLSDKKVSIEGIIYKPPEILENKIRLYLDVEKLSGRDTNGKVKITLYRDTTDANYKDRVRIKDVKLHIPRNFKNPGGFDYKRFMEDQGIYVIGSISKGNQIEVLDKDKGCILSYIYKSKERLSLFIEKNAPPEESSVLKTMVFGERSAISKEMRNIFSSTGIAHLLAVSGLHVGFVAFAAFLIFKKFFSFLFLRFYHRLFLIGAVQRFAAFFTMFPVLYYSILVGASPSTVRAAIMAIVYLLSIVLYREGDIYNTLSLAALIILIWHPPSLFNIGFQLSFIAVLSIAYGFSRALPPPTPPYKGGEEGVVVLLPKNPVKMFFLRHRWLYNYTFSSIFATLGTLPIIAYHFNLISIIGPIVNILAIPLASLIVPLTLIFSVISNLSEQIASLLINIPVFLTFILVKIAKFFTNIPYYSMRVQTPSLLTIFMIYPLLVGILNFKRHRWIKIGTISICLFLVISSGFRILSHHSSLITHHFLRVTFIDVGQAECSLIQFPNGKTMLIDGGRLMDDFDAGGSIVAPYLWDKGITKIDYVIGSHPDSDHVGGLLFILNEMAVKNYFDNGQESIDLIHVKLREIAREKNIPYRALYAGDEIKIDERVKVEILHPPFNSNPKSEIQNPKLMKGGHDNNFSIVIKITYGNFSALFTGDIEKEAERFLINQMSEARSQKPDIRSDALKATVLKVMHHGSSSSSSEEFIKEVSPEVAVFSVGYNNPFRHPNKKVLARYRDAGAKIYRTDRDGLIEIESDGKGYTVKTHDF